MQAEQCSRVLGIPAFCIPTLAIAGLLESITDHDALLMSKVEIFRTESVIGLASAIRNLPLVGGQRREVSVAKALLRRLNPADWVDVVSLLISGEIPVLRKSERTDGALGTLLVDRDVIAHVLASLSDRDLPSTVFLSRSVAGQLLGVTGAVITHAVKAGLLKGQRSQSEMKISLVDLAAFHRSYVMTSEAADTVGVSTPKLAGILKRYGLRPTIVLHRSPAWVRHIAEPVFASIRAKEHATSGESEFAKQVLFRVGVCETGVEAVPSIP